MRDARRRIWQHTLAPVKFGQTLNTGKAPRVPDNLIISGAVHGQKTTHCLGVVCQTVPVVRYLQRKELVASLQEAVLEAQKPIFVELHHVGSCTLLVGREECQQAACKQLLLPHHRMGLELQVLDLRSQVHHSVKEAATLELIGVFSANCLVGQLSFWPTAMVLVEPRGSTSTLECARRYSLGFAGLLQLR